ncbi:hypothetical protein M634_13035 [Vibrio parahaemolyticus O1:Kuk str. FDA_R31]|uniref:hypothetical protein n=1 Tax=Vibrio harveyi group TaxID=717610 RepID=UPI000359121D|nr:MULTISPECIES: hypothetical protein [Vibrio harveyi group]AGQ92422.1 hypothetical protein M634_13035 [Vibrio parahaemolyticus O1:Kuk str. FDA_R31]EJB0393431.1 hypothetical protein [Vibrio parahaemolyticus]EJG2012786.1 hypothetical protein [Vibrio parahaemolyticus]EJG2026526.1 hypothetical protein [Vibrio parahaemolyticus]ODW68673.1 hypothetical protein BBL89_08385 [Vibrio parahaemolyticus]
MDVNTIKRIIFRLFPEFTGQWHLPRWGKVVALPELPEEGDLSDRFYPHYAVDVQLLDEKGMEYEDKPPLQAVPLPVPGLGDHAGRLEPPAIGSIVELGFMFGQPDKPFIRCVLPLGFKLPGIKEGESRYQQRQGVYHLVDQEGNFERKTDKDDKLECLNQRIKVLENRLAEIEGDHTEIVKGDKTTTAKNITEDADSIKMNGGKGVCTGASICPFMGKPHVDVSNTVFAGK